MVNNNPIFFIILLVLLWLLNFLSSFFYLKKINNRILYFKKKYYKTEAYMGAAVEKVSKFRKVMMIMISDANGNIIDCEYLFGFTNFCNFKTKKDFIGQNIFNNHIFMEDKFSFATNVCVEKISEQMN